MGTQSFLNVGNSLRVPLNLGGLSFLTPLSFTLAKLGPLMVQTWPTSNLMSFRSKILKNLKNEFRVKFGARVKIKLQIVFKTINLIYPENLCLSGLFLSKEELHEINAPLPQ